MLIYELHGVHQRGKQFVAIEVKWILYVCMLGFKLKFLMVYIYSRVFLLASNLDSLMNPVPSVLNIMRLCLPGTVQDAGSHKIGGHRPT